MRPGPVAYPKAKEGAGESPKTAYLRGQLLPRRALRELYAPGSLGTGLQLIHVRLTFWGR